MSAGDVNVEVSTQKIIVEPSTSSVSVVKAGPQGPSGIGAGGVGLPVGGTARQALTKVDGTNFNTEWATLGEIPSGGTTGQFLRKVDGTDFNADWADADALPIPAVRYLTATSVSFPNAATTDVPFADNVGNGQGSPGFGNPSNGAVTFAVPGIYLIGVKFSMSSSFSPAASGIALKLNGTAIQSVQAHGAFAQPSATFLYPHLSTASASIGIAFFNNVGSALTGDVQVTIQRLAEATWVT